MILICRGLCKGPILKHMSVVMKERGQTIPADLNRHVYPSYNLNKKMASCFLGAYGLGIEYSYAMVHGQAPGIGYPKEMKIDSANSSKIPPQKL